MARRRPARPSGALNDLPPILIVKKILILQVCYYLFATILIVFTAVVFGRPLTGTAASTSSSSLDGLDAGSGEDGKVLTSGVQDVTKGTGGVGLVLDWRHVRGDTTWGVVMAGNWLGAGFLTVMPLLVLLPRSRLIPDFALTLHLIHLIFTSLYTRRIPTNLLWWYLQLGSSLLMITLGMWGARWREMRPISFGTGTAPSAGKRTANINEQADGQSDRTGTGGGGDGGGGFGPRDDDDVGYFGSRRGGRVGGTGGNGSRFASEAAGAGGGGGGGGTGTTEEYEMVERAERGEAG